MEQEFDIRQLFGLVRRQIWLIISIIFIVLFSTIVVVYSLTPRYTATAKILVDTSYKDLLKSDDQGNASRSESSARVDSEVVILQSDNAARKLISDQNLVNDPEFGVTLGWKDKILSVLNLVENSQPDGDELLSRVLSNVKSAVSVRREGATFVISVSVTSKDPKKAASLANSLVQIYINQQVQSKISTTLSARNIIQAQIGQANTAISEGERKFDQYMDTNLSKIAAETNSTQLSQLRQQLDSIKQNERERSGVLDIASASLSNGNYSVLAETLKNDAITALANQRATLEASLASLDAGNTKAVDLRAELAKIDTNLKSEATAAVDTLKSEVADYEDQATGVRQQLRTSILNADLPPEVLTDIYTIKQESEIARTQYQTLLSRLNELDTQAQLQVADSRIVNDALPPAVPSYPNKKLLLTLSFMTALGLGFGVAFMREYFVGGFTNDEQVENVLRVPLAAVIGKQPDNMKVDNSLADIVVSSPMSHFAESIRKIRVRIERMIFERTAAESSQEVWEGLVVLVTSSMPDEGKSTVALSLARTLAHSGKRTLLIDGDLRKPSLHRNLGLEPSTELHSFLLGSAVPKNISTLTASDPMSNLRVILGGRTGNYATDELVMGERFARLISIAKRHFDYIVIDSPPLEPVVDGLYLARNADIVTFVVRWSSTSQSAAKRSIAALNESVRPGTNVVAVMNQKSVNKSQTYYKYAGYYHDEDGE